MRYIKSLSPNILIIFAALLGVFTGWLGEGVLFSLADRTAELFLNLLRLLSLPMIFLSIVATVSGMQGFEEFRSLGKSVVKYTILTTVISATVALGLFVLLDPSGGLSKGAAGELPAELTSGGGYLDYLLKMIPLNPIQPFLEGNVLGVLFLAVMVSISILAQPAPQKKLLHSFFAAFFASVMTMTQWLVRLMPVGIWAFVAIFIRDVQIQEDVFGAGLLLYLVCVVGANLIQAFIVLPLLLKAKGFSPSVVFRGMSSALSFAFLSRSSSAALPLTMRCAEENLGVTRRTSRFSLPLCATINMNACAGFILTTVLFVSMNEGVVFSGVELLSWIAIATLGAFGNAAVPMGCFFVAGAFLAAMGVPLTIMGVILPVYAVLDMIETAINVWSDACVAVMVDGELESLVAGNLDEDMTAVAS